MVPSGHQGVRCGLSGSSMTIDELVVRGMGELIGDSKDALIVKRKLVFAATLEIVRVNMTFCA